MTCIASARALPHVPSYLILSPRFKLDALEFDWMSQRFKGWLAVKGDKFSNTL
jgi:hypothetical protein